MKDLQPKIRIKDIATLAGVSEGTVDRVLHQRGDVSEKSLIAVKKVLAEMNYTPNLFARSLASKKQYLFACLIPNHQANEYWESVDKGFNIAATEFANYNVSIVKYHFDQYDVNSFINISTQLIESSPDAVCIAPIFRYETLNLTQKLASHKIPFSFIDSMIQDAGFLTYYGQDSFQSGYIAAKLLLQSLPKSAEVLVIRTKRKGAVSNQTISRHEGFINYIEGKKIEIRIIYVELSDDDESSNEEVLRETFLENTNIKAAITFNSKVYRLAMHLDKLNHADVRLIGYDLLDKNVAYLKQDVISYLIAQRPDKQAYLTIRDMCRELIFAQKINKINYVPIDVLMKENIEDYMNFSE